MNLTKQKAFNEKMGKAKHYPRHQNLSKGGMVDKAKHYADGGSTVLSSPAGNGVGGNTEQGGLFGALTQQNEYNAQLAPTTQYNYAPTVGTASGNALDNSTVNQAIGDERALAGRYGDIAEGRGPNPALAALAQQTGTNVANTAALQAGQRGGASNVGLLARQIGQQGAATQQNAVGQAATLQANQQLGALGAQAGLQNQIANQGLGEQGVNASLYGTAANANTAQNNTNVANYAMAQGLNQATAAANTGATTQTQGGLLGGIGGALSSIFHEGGEVKKFDAGGPVLGADTSIPGAVVPIAPVAVNAPSLGVAPLTGSEGPPQATPYSLGVDTSLSVPNQPSIGDKSVGSYVADVLKGEKGGKDSDPTGFRDLGKGVGMLAAALARGGAVHPGPHKSHVANYLFAEGGGVGETVPCLVSPKEVSLTPHQVNEVVERGADPMKIGYHIPGKDKIKHNSQKNDVVPMNLADGSVVIPIDVTTHKDASDKSRKFVIKAHAKRHMKKPKGI